MHKENSIVINAPKALIFEAAADLSQWPRILPHYRWIRYIEKSDNKNVVVMAAKRGWIPIQWTSEQEIDEHRCEVRFHHLKAFTKGMDVVWTFKERSDGVEVKISHDLKPTFPLIGRFITEQIVGDFFIHYVASKTLHHMKIYLESIPAINPSPARGGRVGSEKLKVHLERKHGT
jgi:ribosome-associated toxin RatA of RatAB toxin-antitoxin module